jgi:hypothetical protein
MSYLEPCISDVIVSFLAMYMHYVVIQVTFGKIWLYFSFWLRHRDDRAVVPGGAHSGNVHDQHVAVGIFPFILFIVALFSMCCSQQLMSCVLCTLPS